MKRNQASIKWRLVAGFYRFRRYPRASAVERFPASCIAQWNIHYVPIAVIVRFLSFHTYTSFLKQFREEMMVQENRCKTIAPERL